MRKSSNVEAAFAMPNAAKNSGMASWMSAKLSLTSGSYKYATSAMYITATATRTASTTATLRRLRVKRAANHERPPFDDAAEGESNAADAADASPSQCLPSASAP